MDSLYFTIPEILSLIGVIQCVYILVYMLFRSGRLSRAGIPILYFLILGLAFTADFAQRFLASALDIYETAQLLLWLSGVPLSVLLALQIAQITKLPDTKYFAVLLIPVVLGVLAFGVLPDEYRHLGLIASGQIGGALALLSLWLASKEWGTLHTQKSGQERYWLILSLIVMNAALLISFFGAYNDTISNENLLLVRTVLGLSFVYLATTSLFRIYPAAVRMLPASENDETALSDKELELAFKVENLLTLDKVYHEPGYSRRDLAHEAGTSEAVISKIINLHFQKSLPQLLNEYRVEDAKRLLNQTDAEMNIVAEQVGFNSVASFNRAFKEMTGMSPSEFRRKKAP